MAQRGSGRPTDGQFVTSCPSCGRPLDEHDRNMRFMLPDAALEREGLDDGESTWEVDLLRVRNVGTFVRVLLPVKLTGGYTVTFGTWLEVQAQEFERIAEVWGDTPEYGTLVFEGASANAIPPWGEETLGVAVTAVVHSRDTLPIVERSSNPVLKRLLRDEWPHELVLDALETDQPRA